VLTSHLPAHSSQRFVQEGFFKDLGIVNMGFNLNGASNVTNRESILRRVLQLIITLTKLIAHCAPRLINMAQSQLLVL